MAQAANQAPHRRESDVHAADSGIDAFGSIEKLHESG